MSLPPGYDMQLSASMWMKQNLEQQLKVVFFTIPFGYIADKDNKFSIVDKEADIVRCAFENYMGKIKNSLDNSKDTEQITCFLLHNVEGRLSN